MSGSPGLLPKLKLARVFAIVFSLALAVDSSGAVSEIQQSESDEELSEAISDELLVTFKPGTSLTRTQVIHALAGGIVLSTMLDGRIAHVKIGSSTSRAEAQAAYAAFREVEAVEPNYVTSIQQGGIKTPNRKK